jgi:hypothetical protein
VSTAETLAKVRPASDTVADIDSALAGLASERSALEQTLVELKADRTRALLAGEPAKSVTAIELNAKAAAQQIERLGLLEAELAARRVEAEQLERQAEAEARVEAAGAAVLQFKRALTEYWTLADRIAAICRLERQANVAIRAAGPAAALLGYELPGFLGRSLADGVALPGADRMLWGSAPEIRSPYARVVATQY